MEKQQQQQQPPAKPLIALFIAPLIQGECHYWNRIGVETRGSGNVERSAFVAKAMALFACLDDATEAASAQGLDLRAFGKAVDGLSRRFKEYYASGNFTAPFPEPFELMDRVIADMEETK